MLFDRLNSPTKILPHNPWWDPQVDDTLVKGINDKHESRGS
jgi:hypothetical protein